jgi:hypothetical protein
MTNAAITRDRTLEISLLLLRLSLGAFLLVWSIDKVVNPEHAQAVFERFYLTSISGELAIAAGVIQTLVILAFMAGALKTLTYGVALLMHAVSTLSTWKHLIAPYAPDTSMLFWAAVPVVFALLALFLLRDRDRLLAVS